MDRQDLIAAGFTPKHYEGQAGEFLTKCVKVEKMPYAGEHLVDHDLIHDGMVAVTEVAPDGRVQLYIAEADYLEGPFQIDTEEAQALLRDAVAAA